MICLIAGDLGYAERRDGSEALTPVNRVPTWGADALKGASAGRVLRS